MIGFILTLMLFIAVTCIRSAEKENKKKDSILQLDTLLFLIQVVAIGYMMYYIWMYNTGY